MSHNIFSKQLGKNATFLLIKFGLSIILNLAITGLLVGRLSYSGYSIIAVLTSSIALVSFIATSISSATQRFIGINGGINAQEELSSVISTSIVLHIIGGAIVFLLGIILGPIMAGNSLLINQDEFRSIICIYSLIMFVYIISSPIEAYLEMQEKMQILSVGHVFELLLKYLLFMILLESSSLYIIVLKFSVISLASVLVSRVLLICIGFKYYNLRSCLDFDQVSKTLLFEMLSFSSWNGLGIISLSLRKHGVIIILNWFLKNSEITSFSLANQLVNYIHSLQEIVVRAFRPRFLKLAGNSKTQSLSLIQRFSPMYNFLVIFSYLLFLFSAPFLLDIWLGDDSSNELLLIVRIFASAFVFREFSALINLTSLAYNDVKEYQLISTPVQLMFPIGMYLAVSSFPSLFAAVNTVIVFELLLLIVRKFYERKRSYGLSNYVMLLSVLIASSGLIELQTCGSLFVTLVFFLVISVGSGVAYRYNPKWWLKTW